MNTDFDILNFFKGLHIKCCKVSYQAFTRGETISTYIEKRNQVYILLSGEADLVRYDFNGNKTIIGHFIEGDILGEIFYPANTNNELFVTAKKDCNVLSFIYDDIITKCKSHCTFHEEFYSKIQILIMKQIINLNTRIELLTQKNTRDKLLSYFNIISSRELCKTFSIPFSFTDLADYLSVDRSAMMREISHLQNDGIIKKNRNKITLLY